LERVVAAAADDERHQDHRLLPRRLLGRGGGLVAQLDVRDLGGGLVDAVDGGLQLRGVTALALEHDAERLATRSLEALDLLVDVVRAAARHLEAATREILGLTRA